MLGCSSARHARGRSRRRTRTPGAHAWRRGHVASKPSLPLGNAPPCRTAEPRPPRLPRRGFLTLDFGIIRKGYCSDMTRTVYLGTPKAERTKRLRSSAGSAGSGRCGGGSGVSCGEVDEAARSILRKAGMADAFSHSTGHGVGLEIHESPRVGAGQKTRLQCRHGCYH